MLHRGVGTDAAGAAKAAPMISSWIFEAMKYGPFWAQFPRTFPGGGGGGERTPGPSTHSWPHQCRIPSDAPATSNFSIKWGVGGQTQGNTVENVKYLETQASEYNVVWLPHSKIIRCAWYKTGNIR